MSMVKAFTIDIDLRYRVVTLNERMGWDTACERAIELAQEVKGVVDIRSELTFAAPDVEEI